jgi:hypothetical protein
METKDLSNQTPEQENTPEKEENTVSSVSENQDKEDSLANTDEKPEPADELQNDEPAQAEPESEAGTPLEVKEEASDEPEQIAPEPAETSSQDLADADSETEGEPESQPPVETSEPELPAKTTEPGEEPDVPVAEATQPDPPASEPDAENKEPELLAETSSADVAETEKPADIPIPEAAESALPDAEPPAEATGVPGEPAEAELEKDTEIEKAEIDSPAFEGESAEEIVSKDEDKAEIAEDEVVDEETTQPEIAPAPEEQPKKTETVDDDEDEDDEDEESEEIFQNLSRAELVDLIETTVQEPDVQAIKVKVSLIKVAYLHKEKEEQQALYDRFLKEGGIQEDYSPAPDQLSERFQMAFNVYREKKQQYNEDLEKEKLVNLESKKRILEELKNLISSEETLKKTYDEFKNLQDEWKQIGMVPKSEISQLWQNYHFLVEKFFDKVKINKELKDLDLKKNLERKIELCEKAEELLIENSIIKSFKQLQQYHEEWKETGPVPQDKKDEIWERFKTASDQINERRREYYNKKQGEFDSNYLAKTALCEKAEKLISQNPETLKQWQNQTNEINELLKVWKTIGQAPRKVNNEIWSRFKACLDSHFTSYKEFLDKLKDQQLNNYNLKLDLCAQAEALKNSTDWRNTTQDLIQLQREWKSIGPVPRKHSDKIWKRFRSACDEFFKNKSEFFSNINQVEEENMKKKEDLIKTLQEVEFTGSRSENLENLKNFQREWLEIGHVPIREKDRLQNAFRNALNKHFDKLKIDASEVNALNYKNRLESIKDTPDAGRVIYRERNMLQTKVSKLQEDIMLWENNIGFLAESKNANLVKVEFQKKIDQAKQEVALMEAKLRYLKEI